MKITSEDIIIIGAGPAGLTCAYELVKNKHKPLVLEQADLVGGISRTEIYKGYRFDIGGHRFYTKVTEIEQLWREVLGDNFIQVPRLSRIYYRGKFFDYPLSLKSILKNFSIIENALIIGSYLKTNIFFANKKEPQTFEDWVIASFGERLYRTFFKTYTEKVWGIPCNQIHAEWAKQRIKGLSLKEAIIHLFSGKSNAKSLINQFDYPILGPGMMWEAFANSIETQGGKVQLNSQIIKINRKSTKILSVELQQKGEIKIIEGKHFVSSMPVTKLLNIIEPKPPDNILNVANKLKYRDFLIVALIIDAEDLFGGKPRYARNRTPMSINHDIYS